MIWVELENETVVNLNNIVKIYFFEGQWILLDTSGHNTDISEVDKVRIMGILKHGYGEINSKEIKIK